MLHAHAPLIDTLGGGTAIAEALWGEATERRREAVYKWKRNGIPWRWRLEIYRLAGLRGVPVPSEFLSGKDEVS
jgi:hypothetical protein